MADASTSLNLVRMHFPFQNFLIADEVEDPMELRRQTALSQIHSISSGTSVEIFKGDREASKLRRLLDLALTSVGITKRKARYDKNDSIHIALQKVIAALRQAGIQIFNFHANSCGETDLNFMEYAAALKHSNLVSRAFMFGAAAFVGRVDTITHIRYCLEQAERPTKLPCTVEVLL
ncbi:hypothetical protein BDZ45DRAFT_745809 [Acephala macrosclerotiorum]|nr:hypothetical protein BDZ45DRAFT_745809 [Acephala macrosclerotiorum]